MHVKLPKYSVALIVHQGVELNRLIEFPFRVLQQLFGRDIGLV